MRYGKLPDLRAESAGAVRPGAAALFAECPPVDGGASGAAVFGKGAVVLRRRAGGRFFPPGPRRGVPQPARALRPAPPPVGGRLQSSVLLAWTAGAGRSGLRMPLPPVPAYHRFPWVKQSREQKALISEIIHVWMARPSCRGPRRAASRAFPGMPLLQHRRPESHPFLRAEADGAVQPALQPAMAAVQRGP